MSSCLFECLKEAGLERYHRSIQRHGYETAFSLLYLPPAELQDVGITTDTDRQRFLQLVQIIASFHQGGELSPRRAVSPQRSSNIVRKASSRRGNAEKATISMTNSLQLGYQSSDSNSTSEESPPGYIPSPRRRNRGGVSDSASAPSNRKCAMEAPVPILPTRHVHQTKRKSANALSHMSLRTVNEPTIRTVSQGANENNDVRPVRRSRESTRRSIAISNTPTQPDPAQSNYDTEDVASATKNIRMSAEFLKVQKVMQTKGYNYGLPRDGQKRNGAVGVAQRMTKKSPVKCPSPSSQSARENSNVQASRPKITVCVRKRPILDAETRNGGFDVITCNRENGGKDGGLVVHELKHTVDMAEFIQQNVFQFDKVFAESKTNQDIYEGAVKPIVDWIMTHNNRATCFGYGQTGAGKTHTLLGSETEWGVFFHAAKDILSRLSAQNKRTNRGKRGCALVVSLYEIYCSRIFDLLNEHKRLQALEDSNKQVHIHGLRTVHVQDMNSLQEVVQQGLSARSVGVTGANQDSSRSHAIVQLSIRDAKGVEFSRLSFIDLAGSERACDALRDSDKQNRLEGAEINQSLLALKECIRSLDLALAHTPFRQSKLTQVLRDSFIGNSRTCMIANISPSHSSLEHTMNTLRYASRVKELHRKPGFSTPRSQRSRAIPSSAKSARQRPYTADPAYSQFNPTSSSASKVKSQISRSVSIQCGTKVIDYTAAFTGHGRELTRTPPPYLTRSQSVEDSKSTGESHELPNESENIMLSSETISAVDGMSRNLLTRSNQTIFTPETVVASSTPHKRQRTSNERKAQTKVLKEISTNDTQTSNSTPESTPRFLHDTEPAGGLPVTGISQESQRLSRSGMQSTESRHADKSRESTTGLHASSSNPTDSASSGEKSHGQCSNTSSVTAEHGSSSESRQSAVSQNSSRQTLKLGETNKSNSSSDDNANSDKISHPPIPPTASQTIRRLSSTSSSESENMNSLKDEKQQNSSTLPESTKNPGLPSPKKFLTYLRGRQSIKTKALKQQLQKARQMSKPDNHGSEEDAHNSDHSANSNSSANTISTSHNNLTSNVQQHHQQRILQSDSTVNLPGPVIVSNAPTPPRLPSPKLDRSQPRRSSRISSRSASPGTGGRTTPDERQSVTSTASNPSTKTGVTSASELRARLAAAAAALNSHSDSDDGKVFEDNTVQRSSSKSKAIPKVSSSSDKENNDTSSRPDNENMRSKKDEKIHRAQSEVIIAHQGHISEILKISIEEERLYHDLREQWDNGTSFETYTKSLRRLLARKTQSIEALKVQLALYDRVCNAYE